MLPKLPLANEGQLLETITSGSGERISGSAGPIISVRENNLWRWLMFGPNASVNSAAPEISDTKTPLQSIMLKSDTALLALPYMQAMVTALCFESTPVQAKLLQLGLGAGAVNRFLYYHYPAAQLTTVEIESALLSLYQNYFNPPPQGHETIIIQSAESYLQVSNSQSDIILCDLYQPQGFPDGLYQADFIYALRQALMSGGVLVINSITRDPAQLQPMFNVLRGQFKHMLFGELNGFENLVIYASQRPIAINAAKQQQLQQCLTLDIASYLQSTYPVSYLNIAVDASSAMSSEFNS